MVSHGPERVGIRSIEELALQLHARNLHFPARVCLNAGHLFAILRPVKPMFSGRPSESPPSQLEALLGIVWSAHRPIYPLIISIIIEVTLKHGLTALGIYRRTTLGGRRPSWGRYV